MVITERIKDWKQLTKSQMIHFYNTMFLRHKCRIIKPQPDWEEGEFRHDSILISFLVLYLSHQKISIHERSFAKIKNNVECDVLRGTA